MPATSIHLLLIEASRTEATLLQNSLTSAANGAEPEVVWHFTHVLLLQEAFKQLQENTFDLILLNLALPDATGLVSVTSLNQQYPDIPIIIINHNGSEALALQAIQAGAQDYLSKSEVNAQSLTRAIQCGLARHQFRHILIETQKRTERERELLTLDQINQIHTSVSSRRSLGLTSLQQALPQIFQTLCEQYQLALEQALDERAFKVEARAAETLRILASELGGFQAGPRDVVEIHKTTLRELEQTALPQKMQTYIEEGRLRVLELMGYLALYYRNHRM